MIDVYTKSYSSQNFFDYCAKWIDIQNHTLSKLHYFNLDAICAHFLRQKNEERDMPVLWHQCLLSFVKQYRTDLNDAQKDAIKELIRVIFIIIFSRYIYNFGIFLEEISEETRFFKFHFFRIFYLLKDSISEMLQEKIERRNFLEKERKRFKLIFPVPKPLPDFPWGRTRALRPSSRSSEAPEGRVQRRQRSARFHGVLA